MSVRNGLTYDIVIVGGLGHIGLPLGLVFADNGLRVCLLDIDLKKAKLVRRGKMPFIEYGATPLLKKALLNKNLDISLNSSVVAKARYVIITIGTSVDEYLNPKINDFLESFSNLKQYLHRSQTIIIRSTVYPHTCHRISKVLGNTNGPWHIAYCPERIAQGHAISEIKKLPQLVSGLTEKAIADASRLFAIIASKVIKVSIGEAELAKLFTNAWRYIQFSIANQFYIIANDCGVDFKSLRKIMIEGYERSIGLPSAGFAAGPCLLKDTMHLSAFNKNNFFLGYAAMMVNEGLPNYIVDHIRRKRDLSKTTVGILGMAFKADIDDNRDSLSYKLGKILQFYGTQVLYSDEYIKDSTFVSKEKLIGSSDVIIIGVPHSGYKDLKFPRKKEIVDLWDIISQKKSRELR